MGLFIVLGLLLGFLFSNSLLENELEKQQIKRIRKEYEILKLNCEKLRIEVEECEQFWKDFDPKMLERIIKHAEEYNRTKSNK